MHLDAIEVVTLFVDRIEETKAFYRKVFSAEILYEDAVSAVLKFSGALINLLQASEAPPLVAPLPVGAAGTGARMLLTIKVEDTDAVCSDTRLPSVPVTSTRPGASIRPVPR